MFAKLVSALEGPVEVEVGCFCLLDVCQLEVRAQSVNSETDLLQDKDPESSTAPPADKTRNSRYCGSAVLCFGSAFR